MMFNCSLVLFTGTSGWSGGSDASTFQPRGPSRSGLAPPRALTVLRHIRLL